MKKALSLVLIVAILSSMVITASAIVTAPTGGAYDYCVVINLKNGHRYVCYTQKKPGPVPYEPYTLMVPFGIYYYDGVKSQYTASILYFNFDEIASYNTYGTDFEMLFIDAKSVIEGTINWFGNRVTEFLDGIINWVGNKIDKIEYAFNLGSELINEAGAYMEWQIRSLFDIPTPEDLALGITNEYTSIQSHDIYITRIENHSEYNVNIYNHNTGAKIYSTTVPATYNTVTNNWEIKYETIVNEMQGSGSVPSHRGRYRVRTSPVVYIPEDYEAVRQGNTPSRTPGQVRETISTTEYVLGTPDEIRETLNYTIAKIVAPVNGNNYNTKPDIYIDLKDNIDINVLVNNEIIKGYGTKGTYTIDKTEIPYVVGLNYIQIKATTGELLDFIEINITSPDDVPSDPNNPTDVLGFLAHLSSLIANIKDLFTTGLTDLGSGIGNLGSNIGREVGRAIDKFEIPTGFALGLPKFILLIGGVLIALIGVVTRFILFITTLWTVPATSELLSPAMIEGLEFVRSIPIPVFGNLLVLTSSFVTIITGFIIIEIIRRNEANG